MAQHRTRKRNPTRPALPDLALLNGVVSKEILSSMKEASRQLTRLGIRHALIGGLAVGAYGYPRTTRDVDFLVGEEAFDIRGRIASVKTGVPHRVDQVPVDTLLAAPEEGYLDYDLDEPEISDAIPIASIGALVYLKLKSPRSKDRADVVELIKAGITASIVELYLSENAPDLLDKWNELVEQAASEEE